MTWAAPPITSAGRFSPLGPLDITDHLSQNRRMKERWIQQFDSDQMTLGIKIQDD